MMKRNVIFLVLLCILGMALLAAPVAGGLTALDGDPIITRTGATSPVITITGPDIDEGSTITIDVTTLQYVLASGIVTNANVVVDDTALQATWKGAVTYDDPTATYTLTLTSEKAATVAGETVTVTFTGAGGNAWIPDTGGYLDTYFTATRTDADHGTADFHFEIETTLGPGGLTVAPGAKITSTYGATSVVITITDAPILQYDTIIIDVSGLDPYVSGGALTDANVGVYDTAAAATWKRAVAGGTLTLTSTGGPTAVGQKVTVTFTGAGGNPWIPDMLRDLTIPLTATRMDNYATGNFEIKTAPPPGYTVVANFVASPTADIASLTVTFTDTSGGHPASWEWDFGDGSTSISRNPPAHTYTGIGTYTVSLTATNAYGSDTKTQYINVLNGAVLTANTAINGLTITNCGGPQLVTVDTSVLPATLDPTKTVLELSLVSGFKKITIYALNGGFLENSNLITGNPTGVHLVSEEIAPSSGFSSDIGTTASFNYSIDLPSYPCNAILSTKIWEGVIPEYDIKLQKIVSGNVPPAVSIGTAYTAKIIKTNLPSGASVKLHMSVDSDWNDDLSAGPGDVFIWRISDDGTVGQVLPTTHLYTDPGENLDYYEAASPGGLSTFGISSLTGSNNPFQLIGLVATAYINAEQPVNPDYPISDEKNAVKTTQSPTIPPTQTPLTPPAPPTPGTTEKLYSNANGVITQATTLQALDGLATVTVGTGVVAQDADGKPPLSITITAIPAENLPGTPPGYAFSLAGRAYDLQPDGATFSPEISIRFTAPDVQFGQEFIVQIYDRATGTWHDIPTRYNPNDGTITAQISHFCYFALFTKTVTAQPAITATRAPTQVTPQKVVPIAASSSVSNFMGMITWAVETILQNPIIVVGVIILAVAIILYGWKRRRDREMLFR